MVLWAYVQALSDLVRMTGNSRGLTYRGEYTARVAAVCWFSQMIYPSVFSTLFFRVSLTARHGLGTKRMPSRYQKCL